MGFIRIEELKPGMKLKTDLVSEKGELFLAEGTILSEREVERINNLEITYVNIADSEEHNPIEYYEEFEKEMLEVQDEQEGKILYEIKEEEFKRRYDDSYNTVRDLFEGIRIGKSADLDDVRKPVETLLSLLLDSFSVVPKLLRLQERDDYTYRHSLNVSLLSTMIGKWLSMGDEDLKNLAYAGLFHDLGKCKIPLKIINKPGPLTRDEWELMKHHPVHGYNILKNTSDLSKNVLMGVLLHHEREDGSGYPFGYKGEGIHIFAKIVAVADTYDAMTSSRAYQKKTSPFKVVESIAHDSFSSLDPKVSRIFAERMSRYFVGNTVKLSDGRIGQVVYIYPNFPLRPVVMTDGEFIDFSKKQRISIEEMMG